MRMGLQVETGLLGQRFGGNYTYWWAFQVPRVSVLKGEDTVVSVYGGLWSAKQRNKDRYKEKEVEIHR